MSPPCWSVSLSHAIYRNKDEERPTTNQDRIICRKPVLREKLVRYVLTRFMGTHISEFALVNIRCHVLDPTFFIFQSTLDFSSTGHHALPTSLSANSNRRYDRPVGPTVEFLILDCTVYVQDHIPCLSPSSPAAAASCQKFFDAFSTENFSRSEV